MAKKIGSVLLIVCMLAGTLLTGCGTNKADNQRGSHRQAF